MSAVLCGFLEYISRDKLLKRRYGAKVCRCLLSQWSLLGSWWGETFDSDRRLAAINILKKVLSLEPKVGTYVTICKTCYGVGVDRPCNLWLLYVCIGWGGGAGD